MGWFNNWKEKRKLKRYMKKTPEQEYEIYRRRLLRGESEESARAGLKHIKKKQFEGRKNPLKPWFSLEYGCFGGKTSSQGDISNYVYIVIYLCIRCFNNY